MRENILQSMKNEILSRQRNKCRVCDKNLDMRAVHFDHNIPVFEGGPTDLSNLRALCPTCHQKKTHDDNLRRQHLKKKEGNHKKEHTKDNFSKTIYGDISLENILPNEKDIRDLI